MLETPYGCYELEQQITQNYFQAYKTPESTMVEFYRGLCEKSGCERLSGSLKHRSRSLES